MLPTLTLTLALLCAVQDPAPPQGTASSPAPEASPLAADSTDRLLIYGGRIYLGNRNGGVVEALLVEDGRVIAAGPLTQMKVQLDEPGLSKIDLRGAVAVPGLQDAHGNMADLGGFAEQVDLRGLGSYQELVDKVAQAAARAEEGSWILGWGWDQEEWDVKQFPDHALLSEAVADHPVYLRRIDDDAVLVNEVVLRRAKLDEPLEPPPRIPGGEVVLNDDWLATGVFLGNARGLLEGLLPDVQPAQLEQHLLAAQERLLALGLTCVHDMGVTPETVDAYLSLRERGLLKLRIVAYLDGNAGLSADYLDRFPMAPDGEDLFCVPGAQFRLDGSLGSHCAALLADYSDAPDERGRMLLSVQALTLLVHETWQAGLQPAIAAFGDAANRAALDTIDRMLQVDESFADLRPRIEHAQVISPRDIPRFPELGIAPSMQPVQAAEKSGFLSTRLGEHRTEGAYAWRSLAPGWMQLAFGSNFPAADPNPLLGLHAVLTRRTTELLGADDSLGAKRLDGLDALAGFTRGAAYAAHQEDRRGQLLPGFWADLTVLDMDPVDDNPDRLLTAGVLMTMINGRVVFHRE